MVKIYKFKNVKNSVKVKIIKITGTDEGEVIWAENIEYKGLIYKTTLDELEEVVQ